MGQQVQIRTHPGLLYQRVNNLRKNLGSVRECNKRCVLCTIKFEIFCAVCIVANQYPNIIKNLYEKRFPVSSVQFFGCLEIWLAREKISCLCSGKTALGFVTGKSFQDTC